MTTEWQHGYPLINGWYVTDRDPDLRRYYAGGLWSAPVHCDDLERLGERVRRVPAESQDAIEWRSLAPLPPRPPKTSRWESVGAEILALACKHTDDPCDTSPAPLGATGGAAGGVRTPESLRYDAMELALRAIVRIAADAADRCDGHPGVARAGAFAAAALRE